MDERVTGTRDQRRPRGDSRPATTNAMARVQPRQLAPRTFPPLNREALEAGSGRGPPLSGQDHPAAPAGIRATPSRCPGPPLPQSRRAHVTATPAQTLQREHSQQDAALAADPHARGGPHPAFPPAAGPQEAPNKHLPKSRQIRNMRSTKGFYPNAHSRSVPPAAPASCDRSSALSPSTCLRAAVALRWGWGVACAWTCTCAHWAWVCTCVCVHTCVYVLVCLHL